MSAAQLTSDARALALIARMSLDDKIHLVHGHVASRYEVPPLEHLRIPGLKMTDGPSGVNAGGDGAMSTAFPSSMAVAATFDPELAREQGGAVARELLTHGMNVLLAPNLDIVRHPWWGRATEQYGEDPHLTGRMGEGFIRGVQENGVVANAKHFAGYTQEAGRMNANDIRVDEITLREIYLAAFERAVTIADVDTVMSSFNRINGTETAEHPIIQAVLKGEWGFEGWIMSDYGSLGSGVAAALAGFDQEMPGVAHGPGGTVSDESYPGESSALVAFDTVLKRAVLSGKVPMSRLDDMVRRILRTMIRRGLFDRRQPMASFDVQAHRAVARKVAAHSLTLLKNDAGALPLGQPRSVVLIGADADHRTASGGASVVARSTASISALDGLQAACARRGVQFAYAPGADRVGPASMLGGPEAIPSSCFRTEREHGSSGLQAVYVVGGAAPVRRVDAQVQMNAGFLSQLMNASAVPPPPGGFGEHLQVRWTAWLVPPAAGDYRLSLTCMGSARLLLEGHELLRIDASPTPVTATSDHVALTDDPVAIEVQYETSAHANWLELGDVILGWEPPDGVVPPAVSEAVRLAADSDAAIVFVHPYESEQRDRATLSLPNGQDRLVRAVAAANPRTIVVVSSGGPILTPWLDDIAALIQVYHPGQEGGEVLAAALFGEINPSGRLPVTWPASEAEVPVARPDSHGAPTTITERTAVGYRGYAANGMVPAFAFGHGLGYAEFAHSNLRITGSPGLRQGVHVLVDVENLGDCDGDDVVQIYQRVPRDRGHFHRLVGFTRILVPARTQRTAHLAISPRDLAFWSEVLGRFAVSTGKLELFLGRSALDLTLDASIEVDALVPA